MSKVVIITTGGTIASRPGEGTEVRLDLHREKLEAE